MTVGGTRRETLAVEVSGTTDPQVERIDALFVQSATAFSSDGGTITLHGVADSTVYFADRPRREIGHIPSRRFVELWDTGANSFAIDPPNAVLSFLDDDGGARTPWSSTGASSRTGPSPTPSRYWRTSAELGSVHLFIDVFGRHGSRLRRGRAAPGHDEARQARRAEAVVRRR